MGFPAQIVDAGVFPGVPREPSCGGVGHVLRSTAGERQEARVDDGLRGAPVVSGVRCARHAGRPPAAYASMPRVSLCAFLLIAAVHAGAFVLLVSLQIVPLPVSIATLTVDILTPSMPEPTIVTPEPEPPKASPRIVEPRPIRKPVRRPAVLPVAADAPVVVEPPPALPASPEPVIAVAQPVTVSEPRFDADYLSNPTPIYPQLSRRWGEEGEVLLRVHVDANGLPSQIEVRTSSGSQRLDQAALAAVRQWRFVPAKHGDEPIAAWVLVPIMFNLKN